MIIVQNSFFITYHEIIKKQIIFVTCIYIYKITEKKVKIIHQLKIDINFLSIYLLFII